MVPVFLILASIVSLSEARLPVPLIHHAKPVAPAQAEQGETIDISKHLVPAKSQQFDLIFSMEKLSGDLERYVESSDTLFERDGFCSACYNAAKTKVKNLVSAAASTAAAQKIIKAGAVVATDCTALAAWAAAEGPVKNTFKAGVRGVFGGNKYFAWKAAAGLTMFVLGLTCPPCAGGLLIAGIVFTVGTALMEGYWEKQACDAAKTDKNGVNCYAKGMGVAVFNGIKGGIMLASGAHLAAGIGEAAGAAINQLAGMIDWSCTTAIDLGSDMSLERAADAACEAEELGCGVPAFTVNAEMAELVKAASSMSLADLEQNGLERESTLRTASEFMSKGGTFAYETGVSAGGETLTFAKCVKDTFNGGY